MKYLMLFFILLVLFIPAIGFGQAQPIQKSDYWAAIRSANDKARTFEHRSVVKEQSFEGGILQRSHDGVYEHLTSGNFKQVRNDHSKGTKFTEETIKIGNVYYCRKNGEEWTKSDTWCGPSNFRGIPADARMEFSRETIGNGKNVIQLYRTYASYTFSGQTPNHKQFYESKTWIDNVGRITKAETRSGTVESSHRLFLASEQYEYETAKLKIKIEAPIK